ncbi:transcription termination/antitermination protein NusG [Agrobacterium rosae]|uniref:Transcription termination/antitermination NusG family protein n=1 Tax=Agrobacterium rosae TaxID=1972867 RepID=A0ABU4VVR3_9HYPH|nr:transcription termination/antitermination NusG family protein [Agrobacterium rosae]MDX8329585.1 transcription termination/antitermination NusG family protein [Agrobacterium rosae]
MMQHKFEEISQHVSLRGLLKLDRIAAEVAQVARERESARMEVARANTDSSWIIVQVAFGRETTVENDLTKAGIEACVPMRMGPERRRNHKLIPATLMPVFNGLVFVFCRRTGEAIRGVASFEHVRKIVMDGEKAAPVSAQAVNHFKDMAARGDYDWDKGAGVFNKGDKVRLTSGPFVDYEVRIEAFAGAGNGDAVVTIPIFGKPEVFNMPLVMLEKV